MRTTGDGSESARGAENAATGILAGPGVPAGREGAIAFCRAGNGREARSISAGRRGPADRRTHGAARLPLKAGRLQPHRGGRRTPRQSGPRGGTALLCGGWSHSLAPQCQGGWAPNRDGHGDGGVSQGQAWGPVHARAQGQVLAAQAPGRGNRVATPCARSRAIWSSYRADVGASDRCRPGLRGWILQGEGWGVARPAQPGAARHGPLS